MSLRMIVLRSRSAAFPCDDMPRRRPATFSRVYKGRETSNDPHSLVVPSPPSGSSHFSGLCCLLCSRDGRWVGLRLAILPTPNLNENACATTHQYLLSRQESMASSPSLYAATSSCHDHLASFTG
ncbi:hypothetical protein M413DRAFT_175766 [Hebeloma cylindrosporum]|uniref:Uncharacterized protein n=1 Tax=Hebeloma cylindrosporum TaxID=76867 RepID=A0A0C2YGP7_HEBCY|nr:hypothetical protein M413DRAFT_175766 [Hebeloma cylindrosporum h7]